MPYPAPTSLDRLYALACAMRDLALPFEGNDEVEVRIGDEAYRMATDLAAQYAFLLQRRTDNAPTAWDERAAYVRGMQVSDALLGVAS